MKITVVILAVLPAVVLSQDPESSCWTPPTTGDGDEDSGIGSLSNQYFPECTNQERMAFSVVYLCNGRCVPRWLCDCQSG